MSTVKKPLIGSFVYALPEDVEIDEIDLESLGLCCPYCGHKEFRTTETRLAVGGKRRRKECKKCLKRVSTLEAIVPPDIEAKLKRLEAFERMFAKLQEVTGDFLDEYYQR